MMHKTFLARFRKEFQVLLREGPVQYEPPRPVETHQSIREVLMELFQSLHAGRHPDCLPLPNLDVPLREYLRSRISATSRHCIEDAFREWLTRLIPAVTRECASYSVGELRSKKDVETMIAEFQSTSWKGVTAGVMIDPLRSQLVELMLGVIYDMEGARPLRSYFVSTRNESGYYSHFENAITDIGEPLPEHIIKTASGVVRVNLQAYDDSEGLAAQAYEWRGELFCGHLDATITTPVPEAIACGMLYVAERRKNGMRLCDSSDLILAADAVSDGDVLQVHSFFEQHDDAEEIIAESDLCFVWLWERRGDAPKGLGCECLKAAIADIRKRFPRTRALIYNAIPLQYLSAQPDGEPTDLQVERVEATEKIADLFQSPNAWGVDWCLPIHNRHDADPTLAMLVLGVETLKKYGLYRG